MSKVSRSWVIVEPVTPDESRYFSGDPNVLVSQSRVCFMVFGSDENRTGGISEMIEAMSGCSFFSQAENASIADVVLE